MGQYGLVIITMALQQADADVGDADMEDGTHLGMFLSVRFHTAHWHHIHEQQLATVQLITVY